MYLLKDKVKFSTLSEIFFESLNSFTFFSIIEINNFIILWIFFYFSANLKQIRKFKSALYEISRIPKNIELLYISEKSFIFYR